MGQILRRLALVARGWQLAILVAALLAALAGCGGGEQETAEDTEQEQLAEEVELSTFIQRTDSLRWLSYLSFSPQDTALAYVMVAALFLSNEYPRAALHYLDRAALYDLDRSVIYLNMGYAYNMLGDFEKAAESFSMFVQRDPGSILSQEIFRIVEKYRAIASQPPQ
ncbi:MAG: hypothetical protein FVQ81_03055 [Candidatus Glassbacteria bacterium]|nr:hypothetical protein [Candidatus Glassbacteria bacterium]